MDIRPIAPTDKELYRDLLASLSDRDRYLRFFHTVRQVGEAEIEPFLRPNPDMVGFLVIENGAAIGAAHAFVDRKRSSAEFAIEVRPQYRHRGIGAKLLDRIVCELRTRGVRELIAHSLSDNTEFGLVAADARMHSEPEGAGVNLWRLRL